MAESKWLSRYRQGHINNVMFFMDSHSASIGRRKVVHEFPGRDNVEIEDLGELPDRFSLDIYILADDYFAGRDALIKEIKTKEEVQLLHPYLGEYTVSVLSCTFAERYDEGRMVRFRISAIQSGAKLFTSAVVDTKVDVLEKRDTLFDTLKTYFANAYTLTQAPLDKVNQVIATIDKGIELVSDAKKVVASVADYQRQVNRMKSRVDQLVFSGTDLVDEFTQLVLFGANLLDDTVINIDILTSPVGSERQFFELQNIANDFRVETDLTDENAQIENMILVNAVGSMAGLFATIEFLTQEDSDSFIAILVDLFDFIENDNLMATDVKEAIRDLRKSVVFDGEKRSAGLGVLYTYKVPDQSLPSLVIANSIYGDITNEEALVEGNNIESPFFMSGEVTAVVNNV